MRLGGSIRDSPTYEDFGDPLEARRQKRKEERERAGVSSGAGGGGTGRGRQYISSFEVADKVCNSCLILLCPRQQERLFFLCIKTQSKVQNAL